MLKTHIKTLAYWLLYTMMGLYIIGVLLVGSELPHSPTRTRSKVVAALTGPFLAIGMMGTVMELSSGTAAIMQIAGFAGLGIVTLCAWFMIARDLEDLQVHHTLPG